MIKAFFFDLDGTLLPLDEQVFTQNYFKLLTKRVAPLGYEPKKLIDTVWKGTYAMYTNDGKLSNKDVFWKYFASVYGEEKLSDIAVFDDFYATDFLSLKSLCDSNDLSVSIIKKARELASHVVLATNPIFPKIATIGRMGFIGLKEEDFDFISTYENFSFSKPNPMYFITLLKKFDLKPEEVILFGNNNYEDGDCALKAGGIKTYLVGKYIIHNPKSTNTYPEITMEEVIPTMEREYQEHLK